MDWCSTVWDGFVEINSFDHYSFDIFYDDNNRKAEYRKASRVFRKIQYLKQLKQEIINAHVVNLELKKELLILINKELSTVNPGKLTVDAITNIVQSNLQLDYELVLHCLQDGEIARNNMKF